MEQNKLKIMIDAAMNAIHVNKHRKLALKINYLKGLAVEYEQQDHVYLDNALKKIDMYYEDEIKTYQKRFDGITPIDEKKEKALEAYDKKAYWARRKFKTKEAKQAEGQVLENILGQYDQIAVSKRNDYLKTLDEKYPHHSADSLRVYEEKIEARQAIRDQRKEKASKAYQKKHDRYLSFTESNAKKILKLTQQEKDLAIKIDLYNQNKIKIDELIQNDLETKLAKVKAESVAPKRVEQKQKKIHALEQKLTQVQSKKNVLSTKREKRIHKIHQSIKDVELKHNMILEKKLTQIQKKKEECYLKHVNADEANQKCINHFEIKAKNMTISYQKNITRKIDQLKKKTDNIQKTYQRNLSLISEKENDIKNLIAYHHQKVFKQHIIDRLEERIDLIETTSSMLNNTNIHLSISNLKMYFGGVRAVNDLSFDVKKGEIFGLIGPNGAGKTTVFNCLTQFYKATGGNMVFRNKESHLVNLYTKKTHDMITEGIARSFQNVELIWELTVLDNLLVAAHSLVITNYVEHMLHTRKMKREEKVLRNKGMQILKELGIEEYAFRSPYGLPYGILKKVELARTLMTDPSLIILDEPAAGLNDAETIELARIIKKVNKDFGITIFLVEHDMGLVMSICDTVCAISFGKMIGIGTPKDIQNNPEVRKAYLGDDSDE
ncbi:MAG: ATP-binding cassette domain-containing protein [Acholeplasmataceae bacterium]|nr:ATP-binding cassette domain-containing protein [Acholeplasmataceae bacterium]